MNKLMAVLALSVAVPASATTYTVAAGSSSATIQAILNTAGAAAGNTVMFSAGAYTLNATLNLPCANGTVYTGPNVGVVTQSHLPTVILTNTVATNYAVSTNYNGTTFTGSQGCTIQYLRFSGTQGGILVYDPSSGIVIQNNAFDSNNPPAGGASSEPNIWLDGKNRPSPRPTEYSTLQSSGIPSLTTVPRFVHPPTRLGWALRGYLGERLQ